LSWLLAAAVLVVLVAVVWWWDTAREAARRRLPPGGAGLATGAPSWVRRTQDGAARSEGRLTLVLVGTYGVNQGRRLLDHFARAGCAEDVGAVVVLELDERPRTQFLADLRRLAPVLVPRTVVCPSTLLPGGLQNAPVEAAEGPALRQYWQPAVSETLDEACRRIRGTEHRVHDARSGSAPQQGYDPAVVLILASPGGHAAVGVYAGRRLRREFPEAGVYAVTVLPADEQLRAAVPAGLERYRAADVARWFLVSDNRRAQLANDYAAAAVPAGLWAAPFLADAQDEPWNVLVRLAPQGGGAVLVPRVWGGTLPVRRTPSRRPRYFTFEDAAVRAVLRGVDAVEAEDARALLLPAPAPRASRYVLVTLPLEPAALLRVKDRVEEALRMSGWFAEDGNRHLLWAPTSERLTADAADVPVSVVAIEAAVDGLEGLRALVEPAAVPDLPDGPRPESAPSASADALVAPAGALTGGADGRRNGTATAVASPPDAGTEEPSDARR
jgi:hypothetical protein